MTMASLFLYNVKGLRDKNKCTKIFSFIRTHVQNGIICLQETHSAPDDENDWQNEWGGPMFFRTELIITQ